MNQFPSLELVNEFTDDEGFHIPEPWGNTRGITFNNDFLISASKLIVPYYDGHIYYIEKGTGEIIESIKCCNSLCNSLTRSRHGKTALCSSIGGEVVLLSNNDLVFDMTRDTILLDEADTTTNLALPLSGMENSTSTLDDPIPITKNVP